MTYEPVFKLGKTMLQGMEMLAKIDELCSRFPGLDCGSCGAPTCRALAEDIVRGVANEHDCIYVLKDFIHRISDEISLVDRGNS